jgi:hypothetical protein
MTGINRKRMIVATLLRRSTFLFLRDERKIALRNKIVEARMKAIVANSAGLRPVGW